MYRDCYEKIDVDHSWDLKGLRKFCLHDNVIFLPL